RTSTPGWADTDAADAPISRTRAALNTDARRRRMETPPVWASRLRAAAPRKVPSTVGRGVVAVKATGASRHHETGRCRSVECGVRRIDTTSGRTYLLVHLA